MEVEPTNDPAVAAEKPEEEELVDPLTLPPHGTEIFIGSIDRGATEDQIRSFASQAGDVFSVKMVFDTNNPSHNRGFCFVTYTNKESALRAMDQLHGKELNDFPGFRVRVQPSQVKNKLWLGGLSYSMDQEQLKEALDALDLKGLVGIEISQNKDFTTMPNAINRGYAFLEFYNHTAAIQAKRKLSHPDVRIADRPINIDLAEPTSRDSASVSGTKAVFVGSLPAAGVTEEQLKEVFKRYGEIDKVIFPRPKEGEDHPRFAFVHFSERVSAARAVEDENKPEIDGSQLIVNYGKSGSSQHSGFGGGRGGGRGGYHSGYGGAYPAPFVHPYQQPYGMMPMMPVQLPNGSTGYMMMGGPAPMGRGGHRGGYSRGGGRRGGGGYSGRGGPRFQPY